MQRLCKMIRPRRIRTYPVSRKIADTPFSVALTAGRSEISTRPSEPEPIGDESAPQQWQICNRVEEEMPRGGGRAMLGEGAGQADQHESKQCRDNAVPDPREADGRGHQADRPEDGGVEQ